MKHWKLLIAGILSLIVVQVASADVTTTPNNQAAGDSTTLYTSISASSTSIQLNALYKYLNGVRTKQCIDTQKGFATISDTSRTEWISWSGTTCSSSKITTLTGVRRGLSPASPSFVAGTGIAFDGGSIFRVIDYPIFYNNSLYKDIVNTLTGSGQITGTETGNALLRLPPVTTTQRDSFTNTANGDLIYNSTTGTFQYKATNTWINFGSGASVLNANDTTAGKVQIGPLADLKNVTATGSTGAQNVLGFKWIVKNGTGSSTAGRVPSTNQKGVISATLGGTGTGGTRGVASGAILVAQGSGSFKPIYPGAADTVLKSDGKSMQFQTDDNSAILRDTVTSATANAGTSTTNVVHMGSGTMLTGSTLGIGDAIRLTSNIGITTGGVGDGSGTLYIGSTMIFGDNTNALKVTGSSQSYYVNFTITFKDVSSNGSVIVDGFYINTSGTLTYVSQTTTGINFTQNQRLQWAIKFSTSNVSNAGNVNSFVPVHYIRSYSAAH